MTRARKPLDVRLAMWLAVLAAVFIGLAAAPAPAHAACANPVACENALPGTPPSNWQVDGSGDPTIQGFATQISVTPGQTINFKIKSATTNYHVDILRLGYYGGDGARTIASDLKPTGTSTQPSCLTDANTGLIDCGNWGVSLSWTVPSNAVSGVYMAHLVRNDTGGDSQIMFVVRDDSSHSAMVVSTSDATWNAYNSYGGNSLYVCSLACPPGNPLAYKSAFKVSYNRPLDTEGTNGHSAFFNGGEYPMVRFLEHNGYDVSYISSVDVATRPSLLLNHDVFVSSGHDEYWSASQRANVEAARNAGVNLAFFSGNEVFWRTRWEPSIDGSNTANRTMVAYKDTHFNARQDPIGWTGAWADPRFTTASEATPANALTGQEFVVNSGTADIKVPAQYAKLRFWRNTPVANLGAGQSVTLGKDTLGYEWDVDADNGYRPAGAFDLSSTTVSGLQVFTDYGSTTSDTGTATHNMTLYRAPSGALVFGAGTVQWSWGLDDDNSGNDPANTTMQQATVNLLADMGAQPATLQSGLVAATASTDHTAPTSTITSVPSSAADGSKVTISGTATDAGGGVVAGVEVSTDGGSTWHPATGTSSWTYSWIAHGNPTATIKVRAADDSGNIETPGAGTPVSVTCPCSLWGTGYTPTGFTNNDNQSIEVGVKFTADTYGQVTGIRFYKPTTDTGTHTGTLWSADGKQLAQATFTNESASGWQTATFSSPVTVLPNTTYVASYHAPNGGYAATSDWFWRAPAPVPQGGAVTDAGALNAVHADSTTSNGVFAYSSQPTFPTTAYNAANYWVDVTYAPIPASGQVMNVTATAGRASATVNWSAPSSGGAPTMYQVTPYVGSTAQPATTVTGTPPATGVTIKDLKPGTSYTFTVQASNPNGAGPVSSPSNAVTVLAPIAPSAPTAVSAAPATGSARVTWTAPDSDGGSDLTGYSVTPYANGTAQSPVAVDPATTTVTLNNLTNGTPYTFTVTATNAIGSTTSTASAAVTPDHMLFDLDTPAIVDGLDGSPVELGMKFKSDAYGTVTGLRFYKATANNGTHVGSLWTAGGTLLARATFANESASGWQSVTFDKPVQITAGTTYVASYFAPNGHYSISTSDFTSPVDNPPLHSIANGVSANGLYAYTGAPTFPQDSYQAANYWVDVMFEPTPAPGQVTGVSATAGRASATVSWSVPATGGTPTSYDVTPYVNGTAQTTQTVSGDPPATSTTIKGLTPGTAYTFKVRASNFNGSGPVSSASNAVTPLAPVAPDAPTGVFAEPASKMARVNWTAPASDGGSALTGYTVTTVPDSGTAPVQVDPGQTSVTLNGLTDDTNYRFKVTATNAVGSTDSLPSAAVTPERTLFDLATPATVDGGDGSGVELGVKFTADVDGTVTGVRFYKAAGNTGTHVGSLWTAGGTLLARATFSGESTSGWQTATFDTPVAVTAGTTYVASYYAPNGHYSITSSGLSAGADNAPLHALPDGTSENGVYAYNGSATFPNNSYRATNYWVDVDFSPAPTPGMPTGVSATAGNASATVNWTAPADGGAATGYTVTPYIGATAQTPKRVTGTPPATSTTISGLTAGTAYTFTVTATNNNGSGPESAHSSAVTPTAAAAPTAPTGLSVEPASTSARVTWTAPSSDGGSAITGYKVTPYAGQTAGTPVSVAADQTNATVTSLTTGTAYTFTVTATNAIGSTESAHSGAVTLADTLLDLGTPSKVDGGDTDAIELGVKFTSDVAGSVTGIRFYKAAANTGTHVGSLWTAGGTLLARATFSGESGSGWQSVMFDTPVSITAGTTYVASYHTSSGHYSVTGSAFSSALDNPPLHALANGVSANGVYAYSTTPTMPGNDFNATNYWVDLMFLPAGGQ